MFTDRLCATADFETFQTANDRHDKSKQRGFTDPDEKND